MNGSFGSLFFFLQPLIFMTKTQVACIALAVVSLRPLTSHAGEPLPSKGNTTYHVDPARGDDSRDDVSPATSWKSFARVNQLRLAAGDRVLVAPGLHEVSLKPLATGTADKPVVVRFLSGTHEFAAENAVRKPWFISNSCDAPTVPKPAAILIENSKHLRLEGAAEKQPTLLLMGGRMIEFVNRHSEDITYRGLTFDLKRPTVSEFRVREVKPNSAVIRIAEGSTWRIMDGRFEWTGDLGSGGVMVQQADLEQRRCWRVGIGWNPFATASATDLGDGSIQLEWPSGNFGLLPNRQFQFRHVFRDSAGGFNERCRNLRFEDCTFHALTNMGIVSQFTENLVFRNVNIIPPPGTLRTCPCWADALHFSGCRGRILVENCRFSGLQDDPVNVHGTHLRIIGKTAENQLHLRFMHPQTYGFAAFAPGDEVAVISHTNLNELPDNPRRKVTAIEAKPGDSSGKDWLLTLDGPAPAFGQDDVIDNVSWYPDFTARGNHVEMDSCRGFLITTRGKALIEDNTFHSCAMPGLLIENDANGWFESGPIHDLTVKGNRFIGCGIHINPQTRTPEQPVHRNIRIVDNFFDESGIDAKGVEGLTITGNRFTKDVVIHTGSCKDITLRENRGGVSR